MSYTPLKTRYAEMRYNKCGRSGLKLPAISLGLWHNLGDKDNLEQSKKTVFRAFDLGITHFDLANNYGPPPGSAERNFGKLLAKDLKPYRDELVISTKAGYGMWPGPYGDFGSRKYLLSSLDQSLSRLGLDYVDIFYHHRPDPDTPLEETLGAVDSAIRQGKALYAGISNYGPDLARKAAEIFASWGTPFIIHQPAYSMFNRWVEDGLLDVLKEKGVGCIVFSPLAQGLLTDRYLKGLPKDSRAVKSGVFLKKENITEETLEKVRKLDALAKQRGQSLAQMALAWVMRSGIVTSVLIGASRPSQIDDNVGFLAKSAFAKDELDRIEEILNNK